jgi:2-dehydro-3-deoxyglucarate aldolase
MIRSNLKKKLKKRERVYAYWITNSDLTTLEIVLKSGIYDSFVVDMEHFSISFKNLEEIIRLIDAYKKPTLVRIEKIEAKNISKSLDLGATGIIAPNVNSEEDLNLLIDSIYYPLKGSRGVGLTRSSNHGMDFNNYYKQFNNSVVIIPMIENIKALNALNEIIKNKNIDGILIGPYDLSASIGIPGKFKQLKFKKIIKKILDMTKKNKLTCGMHLVHANDANLLNHIKAGYNFIPFSTDIQIFVDGLSEKLKTLKKVK